MAQLNKSFQKDLNDLHATFRKQNIAANSNTSIAAHTPVSAPVATAAPSSINYSGVGVGAGTTSVTNGNVNGITINGSMTAHTHTHTHHGHATQSTSVELTSSSTGTAAVGALSMDDTNTGAVSSSTSAVFLEKLSGTLNHFWTDQLHQMRDLGASTPQTEHDFKNHNDLPLARIKRIMKSDEDVRMISAEAPVLFAKACEMFILELTLRSWSYSENNKRRTLQKEDIREAIQRTDIFDFLVDVIH